MKDEPGTGERTYYVDGMHCAACEVIVEKKLIGLDNVRFVEASTSSSKVLVEYQGKAPTISQLNEVFRGEGYTFALNPPGKAAGSTSGKVSYSKIAIAVIVALGLIALLQKAGLSKLVTVNTKSALPAFLLLGLVAGFSSCAALVGGIVLSMSRQWGELHSPDDPLKKRLEPHLLFNVGRLVSFACLGALLALVGSAFRLTPSLSAGLVIVVSIVMIMLGLQMLGVRFLQRFQMTMPKSVSRYIADESNFKGRYMPFTLGALTFFIPCGFCLTAQGFALLSGKPWQGALIMLFFALGTLPMLLIIAFSSVKFLEKPRTAETFLKVAGVLVLFFALFNINNQLVVLNAPNLADIFSPSSAATTSAKAGTGVQLPPMINGKQVIKMEASSSGYNPNDFTVRAGVPVRWEITDTGTTGCTSAVISADLFGGQISLAHGTTSSKEFTPSKPGQYRFSCWMGMVTGVINVVDAKTTRAGSGSTKSGAARPKAPTPSSGGC